MWNCELSQLICIEDDIYQQASLVSDATHFGRAKIKGHTIRHICTLLTNVPTKCQTSTPYGIQEIAKTIFSHYDKVKSKSHHDVAHLQPLSNVTTKYQLTTLYGVRDIAQPKC